jgi:hypothetical protein
VWAVVWWLAVERVWVGACGVLVQERATYFVLVLPAVVLRAISILLLPCVVVVVIMAVRGTYACVWLAIGLVVVGHDVQLSVACTCYGNKTDAIGVVVLMLM